LTIFVYGNIPREEFMNHDTTLSPLRKTAHNVTYVPPDSKMIKEYAAQVCAHLGQQNSNYPRQEVVTGFTSYLQFVAHLTAKYLNRGYEEFLLRGYKKNRGKG
jgi:hypothetical protein